MDRCDYENAFEVRDSTYHRGPKKTWYCHSYKGAMHVSNNHGFIYQFLSSFPMKTKKFLVKFKFFLSF